jgi:hypothetical protein
LLGGLFGGDYLKGLPGGRRPWTPASGHSGGVGDDILLAAAYDAAGRQAAAAAQPPQGAGAIAVG